MPAQGRVVHVAEQAELLVIIDGANEVSKGAQAALGLWCNELQAKTSCHLVWVNRLTSLDAPVHATLHATIDRVSVVVARAIFDSRFEAGDFDSLGEHLKSILRRPFFLDLAIRSGRKFAGNTLWSGIFSEFFHEHFSLSEHEIDQLARATLGAMSSEGRLNTDLLEKNTDASVWQKVLAAQVKIVAPNGDFEHQLWRDYLLSRAIQLNPEIWKEQTFDIASTFGTSTESLSMVAERLESSDDCTRFIKAVYDWNYGAALECVARLERTHQEHRSLPENVSSNGCLPCQAA